MIVCAYTCSPLPRLPPARWSGLAGAGAASPPPPATSTGTPPYCPPSPRATGPPHTTLLISPTFSSLSSLLALQLILLTPLSSFLISSGQPPHFSLLILVASFHCPYCFHLIPISLFYFSSSSLSLIAQKI
jgi:hypothetical protein